MLTNLKIFLATADEEESDSESEAEEDNSDSEAAADKLNESVDLTALLEEDTSNRQEVCSNICLQFTLCLTVCTSITFPNKLRMF